MSSDSDYLPSLRVLGAIALIMFLISMPMFRYQTGPGAYLREYWGILWHFSMFLLMAKLPAPSWGRAAGFAWITLDILSGVLSIRHMPADLAWNVRLAAHMFEGVWMMAAALVAPGRWIQILGFLAGLVLPVYTLISPWVGGWFLVLGAPPFIAWMVMIALGKYRIEEGAAGPAPAT